MDQYSRTLATCLMGLTVAAAGAAAEPPRRASAPFGGLGELELEIAGAADAAVQARDATPERVLATLRAGSVRARVGAQKLAYDSLIHRDLDRRGAVASWDLGGGARFRGFGLQSRAEAGYQRLVGAERVDYELNGLVIEHPVLAAPGGAVDLAFGWISGAARADQVGGRGGDAWSLAADAALLARRLRVQAEYAGSSFDWAPGSDGEPSRPGAEEAYRLDIELRAAETAPVDWHLGTELSEVGRRFASLGNPGLGTNRRLLRTHGGIDIGAWQLDLDLQRQQDNPAREPVRPVRIKDRLQLATAWSPGSAGAIDTIGVPACKLTATISRKREQAGADATGSGTQAQASFALALQSEFSQARGLWGVRAKGGIAPGAIDAADGAGVRSLGIDVYGDVEVGVTAPAKPALSWKRRRDAVTGTRIDTWRAKVASLLLDLQANLRAAIDFSVEHRERSNTPTPDLAADIGTDFVWTLQRPSLQRRGLALVLSGSLVTGRPQGGSDRAVGYGLMVSLTTDNPLGAW